MQMTKNFYGLDNNYAPCPDGLFMAEGIPTGPTVMNARFIEKKDGWTIDNNQPLVIKRILFLTSGDLAQFNDPNLVLRHDRLFHSPEGTLVGSVKAQLSTDGSSFKHAQITPKHGGVEILAIP